MTPVVFGSGVQNNMNYIRYSREGGYTLFYVADGHRPLCTDCALDEHDEEGTEHTQHVNWEDENLYCNTCSEQIEASYEDDETESYDYNTPDDWQ